MAGERFGSLQAVVFDLDGTLADSLPDIAFALNAALLQSGFDPVPEPDVGRMVGGGTRLLVERALTRLGSAPATTDGVHATFLAEYERNACVRTRLYPEARQILSELGAAGLRLGVCTNKPQDITARVLETLGIAALFGSVVGGNAVDQLKPAPDMLARVMRDLGAAPGATVMVGDSGADAGAARAAGTRLVLLEHGYASDGVQNLGADAVLAGFAGLPAALSRMTR